MGYQMVIITTQRITITRVRRPTQTNLNQELQWLGASLGLFSLRDKDRSCFRIFIELLKAAKRNNGLTSDELAFSLALTRGTVIHHINRLLEAGLVIHSEGRYFLRVDTLRALVGELQKDMNRALDDLKDIASDIDGRLGLQ